MSKKSRLELTWIGKDRFPALEPRILIEDLDYSHASAHAGGIFENFLIFGDNLLALKALQSDYAGKIACIFIDPPYNTGSAFDEYDDGVEHSVWLSLIRDRLQLIYELLAPNGSLWVTLDDSESHYFKVLCDEVFGRMNFVTNIIWQKKYTVSNDAKWFSDNHDHIIVYAKNKQTWRPRKLPRPDEMNARYTNPDRHKKGVWKATPLHAKSGSEKSKSFSYTFKNGYEWRPPAGTYPRYSVETLALYDDQDEIWFGRDGKAQPSRKTFLSELTSDGIVPVTIWLHDEVGHNHEARTEAKAFNAVDPFSTPKPERLLQRIIHIASEPGDLVLDSFAGSGTTGAVAHKMGRRWIMVELGNHAVTHIVPRLNKVVDGTDPGGVTAATGWDGGGGYRFFRLAPSLMEKDRFGQWVIAKEYDPGRLAQAVAKHMGFTYAPSEAHWWMHGSSSETDFIYVTTTSLTADQLRLMSEEVGPDRTLLVACKAFHAKADGWPNLTIKRIPQMILDRCEWGRDDYSLKVASLPPAPEPEPKPLAPPPGDLFGSAK